MSAADPTPSQLANLDNLAELIANVHGAKLHKLGGQYTRIERMLEWPDITKHAWLTVKGRQCKHNTYPTLMLSVAKWTAGVGLANATGGKFLVAAAYMDGDFLYVYDPAHIAHGKVWLEFGGRTKNTRQERSYAGGDIEPVMHIPLALFERVVP